MRIIASQPIHAPPARAFEVFADVEHCAGRIRGIKAVEILSDERSGVGLRWSETRTFFGNDATVEKAITAYDPPRSFRVESRVEGTNYVSIFDFAEGGEPGTTVATWTHDLVPLTFGAKLGAPIQFLFRGVLAKFMRQDLADMAAFLEAPT